MQEELNLKKSIKKILFETQCDIFAITETNLKDKEKS